MNTKNNEYLGPEDEDTADNLAAPLAEISSELFGESTAEVEDADGSAVGEDTPEDLAADTSVEDQPPKEEAAAEDPNSEAVASTGAPKTWTKEAIADWATIPLRAQQEILKREEDMMRGIEGYKEAAAVGKSYSAVVEPYSAALAAEGINPVDLFKAFAGNHYLLARGTPEQKVGLALEMLKGYNIPIDALVAVTATSMTAPAWEDPAIKELRERAERLEAAERARTESVNRERSAQTQTQVDAFLADPANIYLPEIGDDIAGLLKSGAAANLKDAYDLAVFRNPVTRAKEVARLQADANSAVTAQNLAKVAAAEKATSINVKTIAKARDATVPRGTMDDTLAETFARLNNS